MNAASALIDKFVKYIINPAILVIFAFGFLVFMWGLVEFMMNLDNEGKRKEGSMHMLWGIVGILIMVAVKGIVALLDNTFGLGALNGNIDVSQINNINTGAGNLFR